MAPQSTLLPCNLATAVTTTRLSVVAGSSPRSNEARQQQLVPWVRRPRFRFESWASDEEEDDESDYRCMYNPYAVLGLAPDPRPVHIALTCPIAKAEIHNAYLELSKRLHPDCRNAAAERRINLYTWIPLDEQFKAITAAHNLLMDPYLRSRYHLSKDLNDIEVYAVMVAAKQARAMHELEHMQFQYEDVVAEQASMDGLVISRALYGDYAQISRYIDTDVMDIVDAIDVTVPIQILVQRSVHAKTNREVMKIEIPGGKSKSLLDGFYDPNIGNDKYLLVLYTYKARYHSVMIGDTDALRMPMAAHAISTGGSSPVANNVKSFRARVPLSAKAAVRRASVAPNTQSPSISVPQPSARLPTARASILASNQENLALAQHQSLHASGVASADAAAPAPQRTSTSGTVAAPWQAFEFSSWLSAMENANGSVHKQAPAVKPRPSVHFAPSPGRSDSRAPAKQEQLHTSRVSRRKSIRGGSQDVGKGKRRAGLFTLVVAAVVAGLSARGR